MSNNYKSWNKLDLLDHAKKHNIPYCSRKTCPQLKKWFEKWDSFSTFEKEIYTISLKNLKYFAVNAYGLTDVQFYTKELKIYLIKRILNTL